jgi:hypothetical protein
MLVLLSTCTLSGRYRVPEQTMTLVEYAHQGHYLRLADLIAVVPRCAHESATVAWATLSGFPELIKRVLGSFDVSAVQRFWGECGDEHWAAASHWSLP